MTNNSSIDPTDQQLEKLAELYFQGNFDEALYYCKALLSKYPSSFRLYNFGGVVLAELHKYSEAVPYFNSALDLKSDDAEVYYNLANVLTIQDDLVAAVSNFKKAIELQPDYAGAYNNLGNLYLFSGNAVSARSCYENAISFNPLLCEAHRNLSSLLDYRVEELHFKKMKQLIKNVNLAEDQQCNISFGLAKAFADISEYQTAFKYYIGGNKLRGKGLAYHIGQDKRLFDFLKKKAVQLSKFNAIDTIDGNPKPIFVVGMPRTGTTLLEQILSTSDNVTGCGELTYLATAVNQVFNSDKNITTEKLITIREIYFEKLKQNNFQNEFIVDKMPHNFRFIPFILKAFPEAKIIHILRKPEAVCWSNFKTYFTVAGLGYSYDLKNCINYYKLYDDLMGFYKVTFPDQILNIQYEDLVTRKETELKLLFSKLEIEWSETFLSFYKKENIVKTASAAQVRHSIYSGSSDEWRNYKSYIMEYLKGENLGKMFS